jgi:hypothetical protein
MPEISPLDRLVALEEIRHLKARRILALDSQDWATYEALHAPDHVSDNEGEPRYEGARVNTQRLMDMHERMGHCLVTVHHVHSPIIDLLSLTTASGIWAMEDNLYWKQGDEDHWLRGYGFYHETYGKRGGQWLFTSRRLRRTRVFLSPGAVIGSYRSPGDTAS